jgi:hypothetical protein
VPEKEKPMMMMPVKMSSKPSAKVSMVQNYASLLSNKENYE